MSTQERYTKIIESLVNGDEADASELLHEAFVEKAREIWSDLVEQDEIVEDDISDEELEEAISDEEADDFLSDIETTDEEIDSEEAFGEDGDEDHEGEELEAEMELAVDDMEVDAIDDELEGEEEVEGVADAMVNVEDALSDLKLEFAKLMGDDEVEEPEMDMEPEMEETTFESTEETDEEVSEETETETEELDEAAELTAVNVDHPDGSDGKSGPVGPGTNEVESNGGPVDMSKGATEKGGKTPKSDSLGVDGPADVKELKKV